MSKSSEKMKVKIQSYSLSPNRDLKKKVENLTLNNPKVSPNKEAREGDPSFNDSINTLNSLQLKAQYKTQKTVRAKDKKKT